MFPLQQQQHHNPSRFVGLKNPAATCYMNSVFQQLYMIEPIRDAIFKVKCVPHQENPDLEEKEREERKYANKLIYSVQAIFAHLRDSEDQFYAPELFWNTFKMAGNDVDIKEQHDAAEFYHALADALDESLKKVGEEPIFEKLFGGTFADQIKCRGCSHEYEKEQLFTSLAVNVKTHNNLFDSLSDYVTGDLLEGDNAYYCEKCDKKVDAVKRMCIEKLPPYLMIQLKRFAMDWYRGSPIKIFDYFEFPRVLDMEPFTTKGVEKRECDDFMEYQVNDLLDQKRKDDAESTLYHLKGVVVHAGEANNGHYYSFIAKDNNNDTQQWFRFDDAFVSPWNFNENESRTSWYGESNFDYTRFSTSTYLRRFSAYLLVYEKIPVKKALPSPSDIIAPSPCTRRRSQSLPAKPSSRDYLLNHRLSKSLSSLDQIDNKDNFHLSPHWGLMVTKNNLRRFHKRLQVYYNAKKDVDPLEWLLNTISHCIII